MGSSFEGNIKRSAQTSPIKEIHAGQNPSYALPLGSANETGGRVLEEGKERGRVVRVISQEGKKKTPDHLALLWRWKSPGDDTKLVKKKKKVLREACTLYTLRRERSLTVNRAIGGPKNARRKNWRGIKRKMEKVTE